jgi:hypothetical protein
MQAKLPFSMVFTNRGRSGCEYTSKIKILLLSKPDFQIGGRWKMLQPRKFGNLRYSRLGNLRYDFVTSRGRWGGEAGHG